MQPDEVARLHYLAPANPNPYLAHFVAAQNNTPTFAYSRYSSPLPNSQISHSSSFSNNSTSDEADEHQQSVIDERKQRRMISNRESARRSRMRKQKQLDELWSQASWLRTENHQLVDKLNHVSESHNQVLQENVQLKEEVSGLRHLLTNLQLDNPCTTLRDLEGACRAKYERMMPATTHLRHISDSNHDFFFMDHFENPTTLIIEYSPDIWIRKESKPSSMEKQVQ
ncbi:hypothetical protein HHK36_007050 [Tetracentron sinense]|uniref:BZIP domain-containing protein n=1 Tax=Tetracentron sinense TaxID=13715 RepID=A0A835DPS9_TETSI|nr:hypothetical protein HHK36_007050 [Tetracentron sinense]